MTTKTSALALMRAYPPMNYFGAPRVAFSPDEPGTPAPEIPVQTSSPEPLVVATDKPVAEAAAESEPEPTAEEPATAADGDGKKVPPKLDEWAQKKIAESAFEAREARRRAEAAEAELAKLKAPAAPQTNAADAAAAQQNAPAGGYKSQADFDAAVQQEANRRSQAAAAEAAQADFDAACNAAYTKGKADPEMAEHFDAAVANLQQVGFMNREMLDLVIATDDPAKVLYALGSDPNRAMQLMQMPPAKRAVEIGKMAVPASPAPAKPTPLSNAPRPVEPVEGSARPNSAPNDNDDDATWFAKRNAEVARRYQQGAA